MSVAAKQEMRPAKEAYSIAKETYAADNRVGGPRFQVCVSVKRDLFSWQKRPIYMAKEAY